ncbi:transcription factor SPT20 homolog [Dermacentor silvarum]|uniref:transcription factor SPT20 homolog n=1 Tax=Dermacentor silvarum TaxID=543639 RepID=UPI00189A234F|nr:transcription factor SPT20 homolog [Dermacentor silvarum]
MSSMTTISSCLQQANLLMQTAKQQPGKLSREHRKEKYPSLQQKLTELYLSECNFNLRNKNLYNGSNLLGKLVSKEKLNCLVLNLYAGNEGYSLMLKTRNGTETETIRLPYEESELLQYIDNEELPPILVDLLERSQAPVFYSGCIVVEVRDHRRCLPTMGTFSTHYVLLKPTTQSVLCDVGLVARGDGHSWSLEDKLYLEAALVMATAEPLCLEPTVGVAVVSNWLQHKKARLSSHMINRMARKHSQVAINRRKKLEQCATPPYLRAHDFIVQYRKRVPAKPPLPTMPSKQADVWMQKRATMPVPPNDEVEKLARVIEPPEPTMDNTPLVVQEYVLETEPGTGKLTRVTILQRPTDEQFFGRLYVDREGHNKGTSCEFNLGTQANVTRYLNQFREIFTEEGRKAVKITHLVPGKPPVVNHTQGLYGALDEQFESLATFPTTKAQEQPSESPPLQATAENRKEPLNINVLEPDSGHTVCPDDATSKPNQATTISSTLAAQSPEVVSLPNLSLPQNVGLHNLMSLTGVNLSSAIPVPISLTMVPVTQSSMLVGATGSLHGQIQDSSVQNIQSAASVAQTTNVATMAPSAVIVSSGGMVNPVSTVLSPASGVLSMPLTVATLGAQTLTAQLVAPTLKAAPPQAVRSNPTPVSLLQVPGGQQTLPLIGTLPRQMAPAASNVVNNATGPTTVHNQQLQMALQKQLQLQAHSAASQQPGGGGGAAARQRSRKKSGKT